MMIDSDLCHDGNKNYNRSVNASQFTDDVSLFSVQCVSSDW